MSTNEYHFYNLYHYGDHILNLKFLSYLTPLLDRYHIVIHYYYVPKAVPRAEIELRPYVRTPRIHLRPFTEVFSIQQPNTCHLWIGECPTINGIHYMNFDRYYREFYQLIIHLLRIPYEDYVHIERTLYLPEPYLEERYRQLPVRLQNIDVLILNSTPRSGQSDYPQRKAEWAQLCQFLHSRYRIVTSEPIGNGIPCTADDHLIMQDIGAIATHAKYIVGVHSGPMAACVHAASKASVKKWFIFHDGKTHSDIDAVEDGQLSSVYYYFTHHVPPVPIVSVNIIGGLGNQLFQIASAYAYATKQGARLQIPRIQNNGNRPVYWNTFLSRVASFLVEESSLPMSTLSHWYETSPTQYTPPPLSLPAEGIFLHGYLQSEKYFQEERDTIRAMFQPSKELIHRAIQAYPIVGTADVDRMVVIHARRTDYLNARDFHGPLDGDYYRRAITQILTQVEHPIFFLASDDPSFWEEIREDIAAIQSYPVYHVSDLSDIETIALLSHARYFIMSNSTFIWWCVYLASPHTVIAPSKWFGPSGPNQYDDLYHPSWIRM